MLDASDEKGYQNETVIIGAHRDAWVYGASDDVSGTAAILEIARSFGAVMAKGWKPKRNVLITIFFSPINIYPLNINH